MIASAASSRIAAHWWVPLVRGIVAVIFGAIIFARPLSSVFAFVVLFGAFAFVDGILNIVTALRFAHPERGRWWASLTEGVIGVLIGIVTFFLPGLNAVTLGLLIAAWAVVTGILEIIAALRLRRDVPGEIFLILAGVLSVVVGMWLIVFPVAGLLALTWLIAAYAIVAGIALIVLAFHLRSMGGRPARAA